MMPLITVLLVFSVVFGIEGKLKPMTGVHLVVAVNHVRYFFVFRRITAKFTTE